MSTQALWIAIFFLLIVFISKTPIVYGLIGTMVVYLFWSGGNIGQVTTRMFNQLYGNYTLMAIPMFLLAANIMNATRTTDIMFEWCQSLVGKKKGALAYVNVLASLVFAGMSGSAISDASGLGLVEIEAMDNAGYDRPFSAATSAATSLLGPTFPPSIPMIIFAMLSGASVGSMFLGGIVPAVLMCVIFSIYIAYISRKRNYPEGRKYTVREFLSFSKRSFPVLLTPVILLGGIYTGWLTPTEAGAISALYALVIGIFVYHTMTVADLKEALKDAALVTARTALMSGASACISYIVAVEGISQSASALILSLTNSPTTVLVMTMIMVLILGCFLDVGPITYVFVPLILPILNAYNINMIHFGVCYTLALMIGLCTPPFGMLIFVTSSVSNVRYNALVRELIPFVIASLILLFLLVFIPDLVMFLPNLLLS